MERMTKETRVVNPEKAPESYLTDIGQNGIFVHPKGDSTSGWRISDAIELLKSGVSWFKLWLDSNVMKLRLGRSDSSHITLDENGAYTFKDATHFTHQAADGFHVYSGDASNDAAVFGVETRVGLSNGINANIANDAFKIRHGTTDLLKMVAYDSSGGGRVIFGQDSPAPTVFGYVIDGTTKAYCGIDVYAFDGNDATVLLKAHGASTSHNGEFRLTGIGASLSVPLTLSKGLSSALPVASGGTGSTAVAKATSGIFTPEANVTVDSQNQAIAVWGKVAMVFFHITTTANIAAMTKILTIAEGYRPPMQVFLLNASEGYNAYMNTAGEVYTRAALASGGSYWYQATYLLA